MRLVIKYGGTSISTTKDIQAVAKHINSLSKKHQILVVCSAISGTTDDLIEISESIKKFLQCLHHLCQDQLRLRQSHLYLKSLLLN